MRSTHMALLVAALMCAASLGAVIARPGIKAAGLRPTFSLETMIPKHFANWREESQRIAQLINPQLQQMLDESYSQVLTRTYVNTDGYLIMLSIAYGSDQRGSMRAHEPEFCYPGAGFTLHRRDTSYLATPFGEIPVRRLFTTKGPRVEPVTYWVRIGDKAIRGWEWKLVELSYTLTGRIPDGLIFRVSSIDSDQARANLVQEQFIDQLLRAVSPAARKRLSGLGDS